MNSRWQLYLPGPAALLGRGAVHDPGLGDVGPPALLGDLHPGRAVLPPVYVINSVSISRF